MYCDQTITEKPRRHFYPIPLETYSSENRNNDRQIDKDINNRHEEADINENISLTVIMPEGNILWRGKCRLLQ